MQQLLITGGAGFVGSQLATYFKSEFPSCRVVTLDNLRRRGSEINVAKFKDLGIEFVHGDVRNFEDLENISGDFEVLIDASAEPSVLAGLGQSPRYVIDTNFRGTFNCLELARQRKSTFVFLSTSRVYSVQALRSINLEELDLRFSLNLKQTLPGLSVSGISESFPIHQSRSFYGTSKLASEFLVQEYVDSYGLKAVINRCSNLAGRGQFGKTDQGVVALWVFQHFFKKQLGYKGFGGLGKQVRDVLHPRDLYGVIKEQLSKIEKVTGHTFNLGGGVKNSFSLKELTALCQKVTGNKIPIASDPSSAHVDIPYFVADSSLLFSQLDYRPRVSIEEVLLEIFEWIKEDEPLLKGIL